MAPYFGSELIGAFTMLRSRIESKGAAAFAGPSTEMRIILERMQIDEIIPIYDSRRDAIRALATLGWRDRLSPVRNHMVAVVAVVLLAVGTLVATQTALLAGVIGTPESRAYNRTLEQYEQIRVLALSGAAGESGNAWKDVKEETIRIITPIKDRYRDTRGNVPRNRVRNAAFEVVSLAHIERPPPPDRLEVAFDMLCQAQETLQKDLGIRLMRPHAPTDAMAAGRTGRSDMIAELTQVGSPSQPAAAVPQNATPQSHDEPPGPQQTEESPAESATGPGEGHAEEVSIQTDAPPIP
jgi:hypothetical protein